MYVCLQKLVILQQYSLQCAVLTATQNMLGSPAVSKLHQNEYFMDLFCIRQHHCGELLVTTSHRFVYISPSTEYLS